MSGGLGARPRTSVRVPSGQIHFAQRVFNHKGSPENLFSRENKKGTRLSDFEVSALLIFPSRRQLSIVSTNEFHYCVRYGNRWTIIVINTYYMVHLQGLEPRTH